MNKIIILDYYVYWLTVTTLEAHVFRGFGCVFFQNVNGLKFRVPAVSSSHQRTADGTLNGRLFQPRFKFYIVIDRITVGTSTPCAPYFQIWRTGPDNDWQTDTKRRTDRQLENYTWHHRTNVCEDHNYLSLSVHAKLRNNPEEIYLIDKIHKSS